MIKIEKKRNFEDLSAATEDIADENDHEVVL